MDKRAPEEMSEADVYAETEEAEASAPASSVAPPELDASDDLPF